SSVYLHNNLTYAYSAYRAESYLTSLYLQSNGNFSLPNNGEGLYPTGTYHMLSIANDLRSCSSNAWYNILISSSKLLNYTLKTQGEVSWTGGKVNCGNSRSGDSARPRFSSRSF